MLRKLIKYEFRATARVMLPLYLVTIVLALLTRGASLWLELATADMTMGESILGFLAGLVAVAFVLALLATFIVAVVLAVFRFRKNLLTDEGYVMFTLPVSPHSLVCSKLIVSTVWFLGAVVIDVVALVSLVADVAMFQEMGRMFREVFDNLTAYYLGNGVLFLVELVILFLVGCAYTCLSFYSPWPLATALPSTRCCCRWPSSSPSRWWCRSSPASPSSRGCLPWITCSSGPTPTSPRQGPSTGSCGAASATPPSLPWSSTA